MGSPPAIGPSAGRSLNASDRPRSRLAVVEQQPGRRAGDPRPAGGERPGREQLYGDVIAGGIEPTDQPYIRAIMKDAAPGRYGMQTLVRGIVTSVPFQMRRARSKSEG